MHANHVPEIDLQIKSKSVSSDLNRNHLEKKDSNSKSKQNYEIVFQQNTSHLLQAIQRSLCHAVCVGGVC